MRVGRLGWPEKGGVTGGPCVSQPVENNGSSEVVGVVDLKRIKTRRPFRRRKDARALRQLRPFAQRRPDSKRNTEDPFFLFGTVLLAVLLFCAQWLAGCRCRFLSLAEKQHVIIAQR